MLGVVALVLGGLQILLLGGGLVAFAVVGVFVVLLLAGVSAAIYSIFPRFVEVSEVGITVAIGFSDPFEVPWDQLSPPRYPYAVGSVNFEVAPGEEGEDRPTVLKFSKEQGRAIFQHPSCPNWPVGPGILESLGLQRTQG